MRLCCRKLNLSLRIILLIVIMLIMLALSSALVLASGSSRIVIDPIDNRITTAEEASFNLTISNRLEISQSYTLYSISSGAGWIVDPFPLSDKVIEAVPPDGSHTTKILVRTLNAFDPGIYKVPLTIESDSGERHDKTLEVYLSPEKPIDYLPAIRATLDMDEKVDPRAPISIKLFLENRNPLNLAGLKIQLQSEMPEFQKEVSVDLPPLEKKTVEFSIIPSRFQQPKEYVLFFIFEREGEIVKVLDKAIEIIPIISDFKVDIAREEVFIKHFGTVAIINEGNVLNTQEAKVPMSLWQALFTSSDGIVRRVEGQRYLAWEVTLAPNESVYKNFQTSYRILLYLFIALVVVGLFYWYVRPPFSITKKATTVKVGDGTLSQIKVTLEIRNRTGKTLKNVTITDIVPAIANVEQSLEPGTLKPKEIKNTAHGTKIIWSLAELDGHEHRLVTYKVKAKLNILGTFSLPRATVEAHGKRKKHYKAYSNIFRLGI